MVGIRQIAPGSSRFSVFRDVRPTSTGMRKRELPAAFFYHNLSVSTEITDMTVRNVL
jgi:hypothetical protein